jgi:hypothetical protein
MRSAFINMTGKRSGKCTSCGCKRKEAIVKHGHAGGKMYSSTGNCRWAILFECWSRRIIEKMDMLPVKRDEFPHVVGGSKERKNKIAQCPKKN